MICHGSERCSARETGRARPGAPGTGFGIPVILREDQKLRHSRISLSPKPTQACDRQIAKQLANIHVVQCPLFADRQGLARSEEHTSELQSLMRISYAVFCLHKKIQESLSQPTI